MSLRLFSIGLTTSWRAVHKLMSLDFSLTGLRGTRFAGGSLLLSHYKSVDAIVWSFRRLSMAPQMFWSKCWRPSTQPDGWNSAV